MAGDVSVVLPTYCEAETAPNLIQQLHEHLESPEIIVVDDDSPDGTAATVAEECPSVRVCVRPDGSALASAVVRGLWMATGDRVIVMDADGQHPPRAVPRLAAALDDVDLAVGSRFVADGRNEGDWGLDRTITSVGATLLGWAAVPAARRLQDPMAGCFAVRRDVVAGVLDDLAPDGFKILLELLARAPISSVAEVPIRFKPRAAGESTLDGGEILAYLRHLARLSRVARRPHRPTRRPAAEVSP